MLRFLVSEQYFCFKSQQNMPGLDYKGNRHAMERNMAGMQQIEVCNFSVFVSLPFSNERRGGLIISALDSGSCGLGLSPCLGTVLCSCVLHPGV